MVFFLYLKVILLKLKIDKINDFMGYIADKEWDSIHLGWSPKGEIYDSPITKWITGYRNFGEVYFGFNTFLKNNCRNKKIY